MKSSQSKLGELTYAENHENVGLHRHPMTNPKCHFLGRYKKKQPPVAIFHLKKPVNKLYVCA